MGMTTYWIVIASLAGFACILFAALCHRRVRRLRRELASMEMQHLRSQINPHFLFNALNAISELAYRDPVAADRTITRLAQLLRMSLDTGARHEISLKDELGILERYLGIQHTLLQDRLEVRIDAPAEILCARVPSLILQPLVENAITHGIASSGPGGEIVIAARREGEQLIIEISDNGPGISAGGGRERIGLTNTRRRLAQLYGAGRHFELRSRAGGGATARLLIPFHEAYAYEEDPQPHR
jgi:LytS/YehU family sensor histidine kinase